MTRLPVARHQVLYVDDDPVNIMLMQALFEHRADCRLNVAASARQALDMAPLLPPALLLLDLRLPDCSGVELLERLRRRFDRPDLPAVAVTAEYEFTHAGSGFDEVWHKPIDVRHVLSRLDTWLGPSESACTTIGATDDRSFASGRLSCLRAWPLPWPRARATRPRGCSG